MKLRARLWWLVAVLLVAGAAAILLPGRKPSPTRDWLIVSKPVFTTRTDAQGAHRLVWLSLSNAGPRALVWDLSWFECRTRSGLRRLTVNPAVPVNTRKSTRLRPGARTEICLEISKMDDPDDSCLFCCQFKWFEYKTGLYRLARRVEAPVYWAAALLGTQWNPSWRNTRFADGQVFASNLEVADYFRLAYGLTRGRWLEERELVRQKQAPTQTGLPPGQATAPGRLEVRVEATGEQAIGTSKVTLADLQAARSASAAFADFCLSSTNGPTVPPTASDDLLQSPREVHQ